MDKLVALQYCPHCGGEPSFTPVMQGAFIELEAVECIDCGAMSEAKSTRVEAAGVWNRRATDTKLDKAKRFIEAVANLRRCECGADIGGCVCCEAEELLKELESD